MCRKLSVCGRHRRIQRQMQTSCLRYIGTEMTQFGLPEKQGLYDPRYEHEACGTGFVVDIKGRKSHDIVQKAIQVLLNLEHRGACGSEKNTGDGAGIL